MAQFEQWFEQDFSHEIKIWHRESVMFTGDDQGTVVGVRLYKDGVPYSGGGAVTGAVKRSDGGRVVLTGTLSGNAASVVIPAAALAYPGPIGVHIVLTQGGSVTTVLKAIYSVDDNSGAAVDPGTIIPSINDLISAIESAVASVPSDYTDLLHTLAPDFSASTAYTVGDYVWYNGTLYRFTANHAAGSWMGTDAKSAVVCNDLSDGIKSVTDSMIANNDGLDFWGAEGKTSQSGLTVTQHGTIVTINGVYTSSTRRRFNLSGNLENSTSVQAEWYASAKVPMENGANYRLSIKPISGSIDFPSGNTNPAFNLQAYSTSGYLGLDAYVYADRISRTIITSDGTPLGCVFMTCNKDFVFNNYRFSVELLKIDMKNEIVYVDTANGLDTNTGTKSYPLKTIGKALSCGYRKLRVAPGVYNEKIAINGGDLEIIKTDSSESYSDQFRKKIELINGTKLTVSASGTANIYQAPYTAESTSNIYKVFVSHTVTPTTQGSFSLEYNAMLIGDKPNNAGGNNKQRLYLPVLTENELSDQGTFWYDGTNHLIKFHPWNNILDDAYYVPADSADTIIDLTNMESVRLEDVRVVGAYNNCAYIKKSDNVTVTACEFGLCGKGSGLRLDNTNASVIDCHAFGCAVDGFNLHEYGHSVFYGCTGFYCGDDGISHHQGCTGIIDGGEWAYNGRGSGNGGGISPTFGSDIETRNVYSHDNHLGIMQEGSSGKRRTIRWSNNVVVDNDTDFYIQYYDVVAWNCVYKTKNVLNYGTLTEYNNAILT